MRIEIRCPAQSSSRLKHAESETRSEGNTEGTQARARASTRNHSFSTDPFGLRDLRARGDPLLPLLPVSDLDGKEGVDGSSPSEGFEELPANRAVVLSIS